MKKIFENKITIIHLIIIVVGIAFIALPAFHSGLWFDEAYSVAISGHDYGEIWSIGGHDVHPVLYYWILHSIRLIFGNQIVLYRLVSVLAIAILGIIGFTHIRKDFGEKVGLIFSFFAYFLPINLIYAGEIRMYALAMLLVTLMAIYAYRIYKNSDKKNIKNWILFAIFSLTSAYTHYYALVAAGIINIALFIYFIKQSKKAKKVTTNLKAFIISAVIQILAYLPWVIYLLLQIKQVSAGFWLGISFPGTFVEMFLFQFTGNLGDTRYIPNWIAGIFGIIICAYVIYLYVKNKRNKEENRPAKFAISIYGLVLLAVCVISLIIWRPIIYARYMLCITGLFIFFISFFMGKYGNKYINITICIICIILAIYINIGLIKDNYDERNNMPVEYFRENVQEGDILLYANDGSGFVMSANFPEVQQYFYDQSHWNVEEAYKAFGPNMEIIYNLDNFEDYQGRVWTINSVDYALADILQSDFGATLIEQKSFVTGYRDGWYTISLLELN